MEQEAQETAPVEAPAAIAEEAPVQPTSRAITGDEFLDLIAEETEQYPLAPGRFAVIRSLDYPTVKRLVKANQGKGKDELELAFLIEGTVDPQFTADQINKLRGGKKKAGPIFKMAKRIMEISDMGDDEQALKNDGSSS